MLSESDWEHSVVSQEAYLCTATHDHREVSFPVIASPIHIGAECWIAARAFVGPGVRIGQGAVVGACSVLLEDVPPATIVAGAPPEPSACARAVNIKEENQLRISMLSPNRAPEPLAKPKSRQNILSIGREPNFHGRSLQHSPNWIVS